MVQGLPAGKGSLAGGLGEVEKGLPRELGDGRVRVPEEGDEGAEPVKLVGFNADQDGLRHRGLDFLFGRRGGSCRAETGSCLLPGRR